MSLLVHGTDSNGLSLGENVSVRLGYNSNVITVPAVLQYQVHAYGTSPHWVASKMELEDNSLLSFWMGSVHLDSIVNNHEIY